MAKTQVFTEANLSLYDQLIKQYVDVADSKAIKSVAISGNTLKFYKISEPVGDSVPAYTITLPEADISGLIPKITGATVGNVVTAKADGTVEDSGIKAADLGTKAEVKAVEDKADANTQAINAINDENTGILAQAKSYAKEQADGKDAAIAEAKKSGDDAQADVNLLKPVVEKLDGGEDVDGSVKKQIKTAKDALQAEIGTLSDLETTEKSNIVGAVNELKGTVEDAQTDGAITIDTTTTTDGYLKSYTVKQGGVSVGVIDIPKDLVVTSGEVVVDPEGQEAGTYIKLTIANQEAPIYINVKTLVDVYTAEQSASQIQLVISATNEISATIVDGSVGATELAANAVTTEKITDGNVTKAKLHVDVQASLDKADSAVQSVVTGTANGTIAVDGTDVAVKGLRSAAYTNADAYDAAGVAEEKVNALANGAVATNTSNIATLQGLVGEGFEPISESFIRGLFA